MSDKIKVRDGKDGYSYPYTSPDLVIDKDGKSNTTKFNEIDSQFKDIVKKTITNNKREKYECLFHDNFYRANNENELGNNGDKTNDFSYTQLTSNTIGIKDNSAYIVDTSTKANALAYFDKAVSDCILDFGFIFDENDVESNGLGVAFRIKDAQNFWYTIVKKTSIRTYKVVANSTSEVNYIYTISNDGINKVSVELKGNNISVMINGNVYSSFYDNFNKDETKHGLYFKSGTLSRIKYFDMKVRSRWYRQSDTLDNAILPFFIKKEHSTQDYNFNFVTDITNKSNYSNRFEVRKTDNFKRSELNYKKPGNHLSEQFVSWDCMLGEDYKVNDVGSEIIMQFHDSPDNDDWSSPHANIQPNVALGIKNGEYFIYRQWASKKQVIQSEMNTNTVVLGKIIDDIGKWVKWSVYVKWGYEEFFEPITEFYKNGELVYSVNGLPNCINSANAPYFKCGIYKYDYVENPGNCVSTSRTMWIDNIEIYY